MDRRIGIYPTQKRREKPTQKRREKSTQKRREKSTLGRMASPFFAPHKANFPIKGAIGAFL